MQTKSSVDDSWIRIQKDGIFTCNVKPYFINKLNNLQTNGMKIYEKNPGLAIPLRLLQK
jgi:hypothetical protein